MRFRSILLVGMTLVVAAIVAATVAAVAVALGRAARGEVVADLGRTRRVFQDLQTYRQSLFRAAAQVIAEEPRLKAVVASEEITRDTIVGVARELRRSADSDLFVMTDGEGTLLVDVADPGASGLDLGDQPAVAEALASGQGAAIWRQGRRAYQVQAVRLSFGATVVGVLVIGHELDDRVAETVHRQTASSLLLELDGHIIAGSPLEGGQRPDRIDLAAALAAVPTGKAEPSEVSLAGVRYLATAERFPGYTGSGRLRYVILRSLDRALAPGERLSRIVYAIAAIGLAGAMLLALGFARRLARPLDELVAFTRAIAGGRLDLRTRARGPEEVRTLAEAMNRMAAELGESREQRALQERLAREMEIASRIQTSILPRELGVDGLEMAAVMVPASEVGGDYYDVVPVDDGCWIGIGDVAGHGLTAGLVMMMTQSAVAALARQRPDAAPRELVCRLNEVLHDNIHRRLSNDEHVTLTLLRFHRDGRLVHAGAHEELLVYRARTGRCEYLPTPGTWLGAKRDITKVTADSELVLDDGDVLLLYTDGVTEAMDAERRLFGEERLAAAVERVGGQPVERIRDQVLSEVRAWMQRQEDDITLLVVRYRDGARPTSA